MRLQAETRELDVVLTEAELVQAGADLCEAVQDADSYEADMEERKAAWRATLKALKEELAHRRKVASEAAEVVRTGRDKRDVNCTWLYALAAGYAFLVRDDTQELVTHRKLKDGERQLDLTEPPYREPTPEQLEEWLRTLPFNEEPVQPEGHAAEVEPEDRAVDLHMGVDDWDDEQVNDAIDAAHDHDDDLALDTEEEICGETFEHDLVEVGDGSFRCRRCDAEIFDDDDDPAQVDEVTARRQADADAEFRRVTQEEIAAGASVAVGFTPNPGISELAAMSDADVAKLRKKQDAQRMGR